MIPGPKGSYNFTRQKLGRKLWVGSSDAQFNLNDPYNYEMEMRYDALHDEHMSEFFSRPVNIQRLIELELVTEQLDAKCNLRDYNMYRKYLRKLQCDSINKEIKRRMELFDEKRDLKMSQALAEKELKRWVEYLVLRHRR